MGHDNISMQKRLICFVIMIALMIGVGMLPPFGQVTPMGMKVLGVFFGTIFGWMFLDFTVSSLVGMFFLGLTGYTSVSGAFMAGLGNYVVVTMIAAFGFVALLDKLNLTNALANWLLSRKFTAGRPWVIVNMIFFTAYIIGAFADCFASFLLMWSINYKIAEQVGYEKGSKEVGYLLAGTLFFAATGSYMFPFKPGVLSFSGGFTAIYGAIPQMQWYFSFAILSVLFFIFYTIVGKIVRVDVKKMNIDLSVYAGTGQWGKKEKLGLLLTVFFILFLAVPALLPKTALVATWSGLGVIGATCVVIAAVFLMKIDGEPLVEDAAELWTKGVPWGVVFMIAATMPIGAAIRADGCGLVPTIMTALMSVLGNMHWAVYTMICAVLLCWLTQVSHNLIIAAVLFPLLAPVCEQLGGDPVLWFIINFFAINAAYLTPAVSGYAAMLHGNNWMSVKTAYGFGFSIMLVTLIPSAILIPLYMLVF